MKDYDELVNALLRQRQIDEDGVEVAVSRQACDEAAAVIPKLIAAFADKAVLDGMNKALLYGTGVGGQSGLLLAKPAIDYEALAKDAEGKAATVMNDDDFEISANDLLDYAAAIRALVKERGEARAALLRIRDEYGPNHLSKYARDVAARALTPPAKTPETL